MMILYEALHEDTVLPTRATDGSAGYDLAAYLTDRMVTVYDRWNASRTVLVTATGPERGRLLLVPGEVAMIPLGFKAQLEHGCCGLILPRSGKASKRRLRPVNAPGLVDSDYPAEWMVALENASSDVVQVIRHQEPIAQLLIQTVTLDQWVPGVVEARSERWGGFGSTGM